MSNDGDPCIFRLKVGILAALDGKTNAEALAELFKRSLADVVSALAHSGPADMPKELAEIAKAAIDAAVSRIAGMESGEAQSEDGGAARPVGDLRHIFTQGRA